MKRAAVLGWPISHSRSPLIHGTWIKQHGLDASYDPIAVDPATAENWFGTFANHGLVGANVTIPHKEVALAACDHVEAHAARLGAVNTLWLDDGKLCGTSTDGAGFMANLAAGAPDWKTHPKAGTVLVLGAGGAARAIVDALLVEGTDQVIILNRTLARAQTLADQFNAHFASRGLSRSLSWGTHGRVMADTLDRFTAHAGNAGLLINTTALGMQGQDDVALPLETLAEGATVTDIVYTPLITGLLRNAQARGHPIVDGLGMLLHQAVPGFERWFGVRPTVSNHLRQIVLDDIQKPNTG